jgi:hypothetical protein
MEAFPGQAAYVLSLTKEALRVRAAEDSTKVTPGCPPLFMEDFETFFFLCECVVLGLELRAYTLDHSTILFYNVFFFEIGSLRTICRDWL